MDKNMQFIHDLENKKQASKTIKSGVLTNRNISPNRIIKTNVTSQA